MKFAVCFPKVTLEGGLSQNFDLGPSFYSMKKGNFWCISFLKFRYFIKCEQGPISSF